MKLPEKQLVAFVAVGHSKEGKNLAQILAEKDFFTGFSSPESTFHNLVEATKKIGGLSFGDILKHPRCSDIQNLKTTYSKEAINECKIKFSSLSHEEQKEYNEKALEELKTYDENAKIMQFQHIPTGKKSPNLQFYLVEKLDQVADYCILHGDSLEDLTIQSFFNFSVQKFTKLRQITTMCDTMACFLGLSNETPLSKHPLIEFVYSKYAEKTLETIALNDLLNHQDGRQKCKDFLEMTNANLVPSATEETITEVVLTDGKILVSSPAVTKLLHLPPAKRGPKKKASKEIACPFEDCKKVFSKEALLQGMY